MKILTEFKEKPLKGDMLIFDGEKWSLIKKPQITYDVEVKIKEMYETFEELHKILVKIDEKLKAHHNILQQLTKKEGE